jgi:hypothetical protein
MVKAKNATTTPVHQLGLTTFAIVLQDSLGQLGRAIWLSIGPLVKLQ